MKISLKFFCTAYVMVLFVSSLTGAFLVRNASNMLWEQRVKTVTAAAQYAVDSFFIVCPNQCPAYGRRLAANHTSPNSKCAG